MRDAAENKAENERRADQRAEARKGRDAMFLQMEEYRDWRKRKNRQRRRVVRAKAKALFPDSCDRNGRRV